MTSRVIASGHHVPQTKVDNQAFESIMDTNDAWIQQRTGITSRHFSHTSTQDMALQASKMALENIDKESLDCIIVATYTPETFIPSIANQVKSSLEIQANIPSFDINAACSGFVYAYHLAHTMIVSGLYRRILVIGVDMNSRYLDFSDRSSAILFGDGAGAIVLEASQKGTVFTKIYSTEDKTKSIVANNKTDHPNPFVERKLEKEGFFKMIGADVFKFAVQAIVTMVQEILENQNLDISEIDAIVAHQANKRILEMAAKKLDINPDRFLSNLEVYGNTSAGSIPILLDEELRKNTIKSGDKVILMAFGGGLTYGSVYLEW